MKKKVENGCFSVAEFKEDQNYGSGKNRQEKKGKSSKWQFPKLPENLLTWLNVKPFYLLENIPWTLEKLHKRKCKQN